jgi:hypothetical protein
MEVCVRAQAQHGIALHGVILRYKAQHGIALHGVILRCKAQRCMALYYGARRSVAWRYTTVQGATRKLRQLHYVLAECAVSPRFRCTWDRRDDAKEVRLVYAHRRNTEKGHIVTVAPRTCLARGGPML